LFAGRTHDRDELLVVDLERDVLNGGDLAPSFAEGLREMANDDARAAVCQDLYFACAFLRNDDSTAFVYGSRGMPAREAPAASLRRK
jgi:hypothetical protein